MKTILVPLDGSEHSDQILPLILSLTLGAEHEHELYLLRVIPPFAQEAGGQGELLGHSDPHLSLRVDAARRHMETISEAAGDHVVSEVFLGDPVETILMTATRIGASLLAMVTHGRSGLLRWIRGSVAEEVLRRSSVPVLFLNAEQAGSRPPGLPLHGRFLVALDGSDRSASVLPAVAKLAKRYSADVTLLRCLGLPAVGTPSLAMATPYAAPYEPGLSEADASERLLPHFEALRGQGVAARIRIQRGDPAEEILAAAAAEDVDLVAMTTRGTSGADRLLFGSVAEAVLRRCDRPLLIQRAPIAEGLASESEEAEPVAAQARSSG